jgi:hypothetical protein
MLLAGCASQPPLFNAHKLEKAQEILTEEESTQCTNTYVEFIRQEGDLFLFYVEIENNSEDVLDVYPTDIHLEVVEDTQDPEMKYIERHYALDPVEEIMTIDEMMNDEEKRHENATTENVVFGALNVFVDLASDREDKGSAVIEDIVGTVGNQVNEEAYHEEVGDDLKESKEFWKNEVLNQSDLYPDEVIGGLVYLPFSKTAKLFKVVIPVCDSPESSLFKQVQINK